MPSNGFYHLLEINLLSAQNLAPVSKSMRTFAVVWLHPDRKLTTRVDQTGHTNPTWNEKFVFRVDDGFINAESSLIMIEIYASALIRDVLIGAASVLVGNLIPPSSRSGKDSKMRSFALQVRRPSGRRQGILNIGAALLDSSMRSVPLDSELSGSVVSNWDFIEVKSKRNVKEKKINHKIKLNRSQSARTENSDFPGRKTASSVVNGGSVLSHGGANGNGSLCSDVGPSPSVVAAAIAKGLHTTADDTGSSIIEDWTEEDSVEGLKTKIERWRTELPPIYDNDRTKLHGRDRRKRGNKSGLFSCFGAAYGCEFSITCGGSGDPKKKTKTKKKNKGSGEDLTPSELTYEESYV